MTKLVLHPTSTAQWQALVSEAERVADCILSEDIESYLVFLLMRFANQPQMMARVLALDYLQVSETDGHSGHETLRDIGDQCLLFSGLFPKQAERRRVKISYFVDLGRSAYERISNSARHQVAEVFASLSRDFVLLMDVLQTMRDLRGGNTRITPLHAFDLWNETGSRHAFKVIRSVTDACPVRTEINCAVVAAKKGDTIH